MCEFYFYFFINYSKWIKRMDLQISIKCYKKQRACLEITRNGVHTSVQNLRSNATATTSMVVLPPVVPLRNFGRRNNHFTSIGYSTSTHTWIFQTNAAYCYGFLFCSSQILIAKVSPARTFSIWLPKTTTTTTTALINCLVKKFGKWQKNSARNCLQNYRTVRLKVSLDSVKLNEGWLL